CLASAGVSTLSHTTLFRSVVGKRFEHKGMPLPEAGQAIRYLAQSVFSIMPKEDFSVESVLRIAAQLVSRKGVKVLVVDPFNRFEIGRAHVLTPVTFRSRMP